MATILNAALCAVNVGNTGSPDCVFDPQLMVGGFLVPSSFELTAANLATETTLQAALRAAILAPKGQRIYPLPYGEALTDNSADVTIQQLSGGASIPVKDGDYDFTQQYIRGGLCVSNQLKKFSGTNLKFIGVDADGTIIGTRNSTNDGIKGAPMIYFYGYPFKFNTGAEVSAYRYRIAMRPKYFNELVAWAKTSEFDVFDLPGLTNVILSNSARATNVLTIDTLLCAGTNLVDLFPDELVDTDNWVVTGTGGAAVTITSIAIVSGKVALTLTASGAYNTTAGGMTISLAAPTVLDAAGVSFYESNVALSKAV